MIRNSLKIALLIAGAGLCTAGLAAAASGSKERPAQQTKLPDWSGFWALKGYFGWVGPDTTEEQYVRGLRARPPYNAEWEAKYQNDLRRDLEQGTPNTVDPIVDTYTVYCATGFPRIMLTPYDYSFINVPGMSWIIAGAEVRQIHTDGRKRPDPDNIWPKLYGWSSGEWQGDTLEVVTTDLIPGMWADGTPIMFSDKVKFTERFRKIDADTIQDDIVIEDPVAFTRPWKLTRHYVRANNVDWIDDKQTCAGPNNRHPIVDGRVTTKLK